MQAEQIDIRAIRAEMLPDAFEVLRELRQDLDYPTFLARYGRQSEYGYCLYGAYEGDSIVGVIGMRAVETMARGKHLHVDDLVVTSQQRNKGIGRRLIAFAERFATEHDLASIFLDSRKEVIAFYEAIGFSLHTAVLLRKKL